MDRVARHHLADGLLHAADTAHRKAAHDVAFRQDAVHRLAVAGHDHAADPALCQDLRGLGDQRFRRHGDHPVIALGFQDLLDQHGGTSLLNTLVFSVRQTGVFVNCNRTRHARRARDRF
jgi:hypothetical protein